jgi:prepilin peptidase CpaA
MTFSLVIILIWVTSILAAAFSDWRSFRIPNLLPALLLVLFFVGHIVWGYSSALWPNAMHFALALAVGMLLFGMGWIGGGDAKLYAAIALWFNWTGAVYLVFMTTMAGLALAVTYLLIRVFVTKKQKPNDALSKRKRERRIPYGVAIALGGILSAAMIGWGNLFPGLS